MADNTAPNGTQPAQASSRANPLRPMRPKPRANPLVQRKGPPRPRVNPNAPKPKPTVAVDMATRRRQNGGWSEPAPPNYQDIPIFTTKKALLDGIRHHMIKFVPTKPDKQIDPTDQNDFARPVTLHRRDARQPPPGRAVKEEVGPEPAPRSVDQEELDRIAQVKAEKDAQRAIDQAKIAPVLKEAQPKKPKKMKEEKISFNRAPKTVAAKKESELRYEEALPWHVEDADGKNVWVGSYVSALSETNVAFMIDGPRFRMIPLEKWYRMTSKPPFQAFTIDEAEALMSKKMVAGRWVMKDEEKKAGQNDLEATRRFFYGKGPMVKTESDTFRAASRAEKMEHDELDVSGDEFQDDDEQATFERPDDEDTKEANERIRREQLGANLFGDGDEQEVEKELKERLQEELERQKYGKSTKKALIKRDRENIYESDDSDEKPWTSSSEDDSSEDEDETKEADKDEVKKEDKIKQEKDKNSASGASSKGTTTPQKLKPGELGKKNKSLKRAGSPNLSESSGNESTRKKIKTKKATGTGAAGTPVTGSRAGTPIPGTAAAKRRGLGGGAGSGSDGEATGGEMSDGAGGKKRKMKVIVSNRGTPITSRAGSPNPHTSGASPPNSAGPVTAADILNRIPDEGITIGDLMGFFKHRVGGGSGMMPRPDWIKMVKDLCEYGQDKRLRKKATAA